MLKKEFLPKESEEREKMEAYLKNFYAKNPYVRFLDMRLAKIALGEIHLKMKIFKELQNMYHIAHGGSTMSLADTAMGAACMSLAKRVVTIECSSNFIKGPRAEEEVYAIGKVLHNGKRTMVCVADVFNEEKELCLHAQGTFFIIENISWAKVNIESI